MTTAAPTTHFALLPLGAIATSPTNPRKTFDAGKLQELTASIKASGVHQAVLVRPLPAARVPDTAHLSPRPEYELVSGERRYRASVAAEVATIPAMVRPLTDAEVLEIQLVENLQRDDLTPLEEAEGYDHLVNSHQPPLTADQVAAKIGKSRTYVYGRLKLLNLGPEGRTALREGRIDASRALLIARLPSTKVQAEALKNLFTYDGEPLSVRDASSLIQRQYMLKLNVAPWKATDANLVPEAGSCKACPKRTGADPDLFADVKGTDLCTDPACYNNKARAYQEAQHKAARESGATIIEGREAKQLIPRSWDTNVEGHLRLDDARDSPTDKPLRNIIGKLMEAEGIKPTLVANPHKDGELIAVLDHATASRLLAQKGHQEQADKVQAQAAQSAKAAEEAQKAKDQERYEKAWRWAVFEATWASIDEQPDGDYTASDDTIRAIALQKAHGLNNENATRLCKLLDLGKVAPGQAISDWVQGHANPHKALALLHTFADIGYTPWIKDEPTNADLVRVAQEQHVDVGAVQAAIKKEHKADIKARKAALAAREAQAEKAPLPLDPAAQASGERGVGGVNETKGGKSPGKRNPAKTPAAPALSAEQAMQGIAAAMQGQEAGAEPGTGEPDPVGGQAAEEAGGQAAPAEGGPQFKTGQRVMVVGDQFTGREGVVAEVAGDQKRPVFLIKLPGLQSLYQFREEELITVEGQAA